MYSYLYGTVIAVNKKSITFDCNNIGYIVNVSNPGAFEINRKIHLYAYAQYTTNGKNGFLEEMYGFKTYREKEMFLSLMQCQGIGPKKALDICKNDVDVLRTMIGNKDAEHLANCQNIDKRTAETIVNTLHKHYAVDEKNKMNSIQKQLFTALNQLGYPNEEAEYAIKHMNKKEKDLSNLIAGGIKDIMERNQPIIKDDEVEIKSALKMNNNKKGR